MSVSNEMEFMREELERLRVENNKLKQNQRDLYLKVSEKGAISLYGLGKFPVSLYKSQWEFIRVNEKELK